MVQRGRTRESIKPGKFRPSIGAAHVNGPDRLNPGSWWFDSEEVRDLARLDAAPELPLRGEQQVLVKWVGRDRHLYPLAAACDDGKDGCP